MIPVLVFGVMMLLGGVLLLALPETHGTKLPDVISDVESPWAPRAPLPPTTQLTPLKGSEPSEETNAI